VDWRRLHNEKLHNFHLLANIVRINKSRSTSTYGERRGAYRILLRKHVGNTPLGRARRRWV
jgi:hypothetical protein